MPWIMVGESGGDYCITEDIIGLFLLAPLYNGVDPSIVSLGAGNPNLLTLFLAFSFNLPGDFIRWLILESLDLTFKYVWSSFLISYSRSILTAYSSLWFNRVILLPSMASSNDLCAYSLSWIRIYFWIFGASRPIFFSILCNSTELSLARIFSKFSRMFYLWNSTISKIRCGFSYFCSNKLC